MGYLLHGVFLVLLAGSCYSQKYYGKRLNRLSELHHNVKGEVFAVDSRTIHIRNFQYDGTAPDAYFYVGTTAIPSNDGIIVPNEKGSKEPLTAYDRKHVTLTLPDGLTLKDISWLSIWCQAFQIDFGNVVIPRGFDYPRPRKIGPIPTLDHDTKSDDVVVVDAQTFLIPNFKYDGSAPDAHFWVGAGDKPDNNGKIVPDENGNMKPLKRYYGKTIVLTLPGDMTVFDIGHISVWCRAFQVDFGHITLPKNLNVPPSLRMLGVAPQTKLNCEVLWDDLAFEVRWAVAGESIVMQLVGKVGTKEYMSFGLSGHESRSVMIGSDVVVTYLDQATGQGYARDYNLLAKSQCQGGVGSCPDEKIPGAIDNVRLLNSAIIDGFTMLTFQRPLRATDSNDKAIITNGTQPVVWAIGPVNSQGDTGYHRLRVRGDLSVDFGRAPVWNCPLPDGGDESDSIRSDTGPATQAPAADPWLIPGIQCFEPEDGIFYAQIGPSGGQNGYNAITERVGWGIAWYINGLLIPEITLVRGKQYTFVVEGGNDPANPSRFHPFYITDDPEGGFEFKSPAERSAVKVFAGINADQSPSATGRLCEWKETPGQSANKFKSFGGYQRSLNLQCQEGEQGFLRWTPDAATPNTVYYQCYTHRYLGWKINIVDDCTATSGSAKEAASDYYYYDDYFDSQKTRKKKFQKNQKRDSNHNRVVGTTYTSYQTAQDKIDLDYYPFLDDSLYNDILIKTPSGESAFKFTKLPPLNKAESVVNYTAFSNLRNIPGLVPNKYEYPLFEKLKLQNEIMNLTHRMPFRERHQLPLQKPSKYNNKNISISERIDDLHIPAFIRDLNRQFSKDSKSKNVKSYFYNTDKFSQNNKGNTTIATKQKTDKSQIIKMIKPILLKDSTKDSDLQSIPKRSSLNSYKPNEISLKDGGPPKDYTKTKFPPLQAPNKNQKRLPSGFISTNQWGNPRQTNNFSFLTESSVLGNLPIHIGFDPSSVVYESDFRPVGIGSRRDPLFDIGSVMNPIVWLKMDGKNPKIKPKMSKDIFVKISPRERFVQSKRRNSHSVITNAQPSIFLRPPPLPIETDYHYFRRPLK